MQTGLFKWKPDYDGAASEYSKAATAFKNAKAYEQTISSLMKASEVQKKSGSSMEAAALIYKELKEFHKIANLVEEASNLYLEHGVPDTASIALERAAKMIETHEPERAIELYKKACDVCEGEDRVRHSAEMAGKAARIYIRLKRFDEAAEHLKKEIDHLSTVNHQGQLNKLMMALVLIHLHQDDFVAADQAFKAAFSYDRFVESEEASAIEQLLKAYEEGDQEAADGIVKSPLFRYMENDFTKLARDLKVPGGLLSGKTEKSVPNATPSGEGDVTASGGGDAPTGADKGPEEEEEEDEFAGGLL
ncbi:hypothetical protein NP493_65g07041 [Ridgeia piscesae]|uniref:Gamma-soluble NSF attachment protein n=1 Tax=Ridgeia piscesae TaxID=27915 RepID=A0AAD9UIT3_RIDPI|nr:hypothetical protein NP493_65g07041 [Ridgeia piscesae]